MKKMYKKISVLLVGLLAQNSVQAQCAALQNGGSASNMFSLIRNSTSSIAANKVLNTITFIHRNNATAFGGNSGSLRFDYSTDGGTTWTLDQGYLNPLLTNPARYPNVAIYNPPANTNTANAYMSYMAPTIDGATQAWNGIVTGVGHLNVTGVTETYNQNGIGSPPYQASSLVNGAPGVFWAIDPASTANGFRIYKGVWNSGISDISWSLNYTATYPFLNPLSLIDYDYNIAFDPTGMTGYFCVAGNIGTGPAGGLYPILYKTTDGGATWNGPMTVDVSLFGCITSHTVSPHVPSMNTGHDLVVDVNGNPHIITTLGNASSYIFNYSLWHHMYDITLKNGLWVAHDLGNVNGSVYAYGPSNNPASQWQAPQAARNEAGTKVFFTWTDNAAYTLGTPNSAPDLFGKAFDVTTQLWTPTKDFTSCNPTVAGKIAFAHIAAEVLEPNSNSFKIATIYGEPSVVNDMISIANFKFLDNITFSTSEFSVAVPPATVTIEQAPLALICPNSNLTINIVGPGQAIWNTGATTASISVSSAPPTSYSVTAQVGCNVGTATIAVANLTVNPTLLTSNVCPGDAANFSVVGNALGYTWTPGGVSGTNVTLNPVVNTITLTAMGSGSCLSTHTISANLLPLPNITITGPSTICAGVTLSLTANNAQTYVWENDGSTNATFTDTPTSNTSYTVTGTAANTCTNTQTVSVVVKPSPNVTPITTATSICIGQSVVMTANGAVTYSWNGVASAPSTTVTPTVTTIYTVTGAGTNSCQTARTLEVVVNALPSVTVTQSRPSMCKGEKMNLTASGAANYTWTVPGVISKSVQVGPTSTTVYTVLATSAAGCANTYTYSLLVLPCTGIDQVAASASQLIIYPNPNNGEFTIRAGTDVSFQLINELGQVIRSYTLDENNNYEAVVKDLSSGIYFIAGQQDSPVIKQKIVVTR